MIIPVWMGWLIGCAPLVGLALFAVAEWRAVRRQLGTSAGGKEAES